MRDRAGQHDRVHAGARRGLERVAHKTVEEIWYIVAGSGRLWRKLGEAEEVAQLAPGLSLTLPVGTSFQFRNDGDAPLGIVAVTMLPWPGESEAYIVPGLWKPESSSFAEQSG